MAGNPSAAEGESSDFSNSAVPPHARMPKGALTMAWWAVCSAVFYIVVGAAIPILLFLPTCPPRYAGAVASAVWRVKHFALCVAGGSRGSA